MSILQAILLGIVQGITELLPISSSAHLVLASKITGLEEQSLEFDIILHAATLIATIIYFRKKIFRISFGIFKKDKEYSKNSLRLLINIAITSLPAILFFFIVRDMVETSFKSMPVIIFTLVIFAIPLMYIKPLQSVGRQLSPIKNIYKIKGEKAYIIGLFQALSLIRGVSRSGITLIGSLLTGLKLKDALEYTFLAGIPITIAAISVQANEIVQNASFQEPLLVIIVGFIVSLVSGYATLHFFFKYLKRIDFKYFAYYRIIMAAVLLFYYLI
jgi:undecaprenyl-diphosphatase